MRTGHDLIDAQHQELYEAFKGISQLLDVPGVNMKYWFGMVIRKADDYVVKHFNDEEQLMADVQYTGFAEHKLQHIEIINELQKHQSTIKQLKTADEQIVEARQLLRFMHEWLNQHVLVDDKKLVDFIRG